MKKILFITILIAGLVSCRNSREQYKGKMVGKKDANFENIIRKGQPKTLAEIYYEHGNFINSKQFPPIVTAQKVLDNGKDWLLIDIRQPDAYEAGHINGAYNVPKDKVLDFLTKEHKAAAYPKVVFICYSGQMASYVTGLTRYAGFDNTYVMLYGMAAWNSQFSGILKKGFGDRYPDMILHATDKAESIPAKQEEEPLAHKGIDLSKLPKLPAKLPTLLVKDRAQALLQQSRPAFLLKSDEFFPDYKKNPGKYQPIFYLSKNKFYVAHIKGAEFYQSRKDLSLDTRLTTLPTDKEIVVYCKTGHTGGNATAYLDMLGYKAKNLMFGASSFMYSLWKQKEWMPDVSSIVNDFPIVEGKKRTNNKIVAAAPKKTGAPGKPIVKHKKKEVSGGCG